MSRKVRALVVVAAVAAVVLPLVSQASHRDLRDQNDTRGPLDVRLVQVGEQRSPRWSIYTYGRWRARTIWDRGFVVIKFDTFGDTHFDYYALILSDGYRLLGSLWRDHARRDDKEISKLKVSRPNRRSAAVRVRFGKMRFRDPMSYRWNLTTTWTGKRCGNVCFDRVPDKGAVVEPEPGPPTPIPSVSVTEIP